MLGISKKEKKPEEPQYYMSRVQMPVMNYKVYHMGKVEKILTFMLAFVIGAAVAYLFYGGLFKDEYGNATTATWISNIVIMLVVGIIAGRMFVPIRTKSIIDKNQRKLKEQFRSMLEAVNTSLGAGNNALDSFESAYRDLRVQYEEDAFILKELNAILVSNRNNIDIETVLKDFGERSGIDDIKSFEDLKKVADDIQARKDELGVKGAFTSAGMDGSSDWRFKTHLANLPIYYEYKEDGIDDTDAIKGTYLDNYKNVFDLYITDSTCDGSELSAKTADDSRNEFVNGEAVFYQNGSWEYSELSKTFKDDELAMIPIYFGVDDANEGLATGTENYWCVNAKASEEDIQATLDFMEWCATDDVALKAICGSEGAMPSGADGMGFVTPFKKNIESTNLLVNIANEYVAEGKTPVSWNFTTMPSEQWKNDLGSALTTYAADQTDANWDLVKSAFVDGWAKEAAAAKSK